MDSVLSAIYKHLMRAALLLALPFSTAMAVVPPSFVVAWQHDTSIRNLGYGDLNAYYPQLMMDVSSNLLDKDRLELVIRGEYPKARYFSITAYDYKWRPIANINDQQIAPALGSANPYLPNADWNTSARSYELKVRFQAQPPAGQAEPNTLYVAQGADGLPTNLVRIAYRLYLPSEGELVGRELYTPEVFFRDIQTGDIAPPPDIFYSDPRDAGFVLDDEELPPAEDVLPNCRLADEYENALVWRRSFEIPITSENPDTLYIFAPFKLCARRQLMLKFRIPQLPHTFDNEGIRGDEDMRYWSISIGGRFSNTKMTLADEGPNHVFVGEDGFVRLLLGYGQAPILATPENGYTYVDLSSLGRRPLGVFILRQILPSDDFPYSAKSVAPGLPVTDEMGEHLPVGTYVQGRNL